MSSPKYSFVIPVLNGEKTLSQCLTSVLNQTLTSFEVIVIDNGSTDNTPKIIQDFPAIQSLFEGKRSRSLARNRGIAIARGEFVAFVDCDVVLDPDWLLNMDRELKKFPLDVLGSQIIPARTPKSFLNNYRFILKSWESDRLFLNTNIKEGNDPTFNTAAGIISRKALLRVGGFNEKFKRCEDAELANRLLFKSYLFGGTTKARAKVYYNFTSHYFPQFLLLRYLVRIFANTFYQPDTNPSFSFKMPKNYELAKKLFSGKKFAFSLYAFLYALSIFLGRNISTLFKKKYPVPGLESGHHELLGQFFRGSKTYGLKKGIRFFLLNDHIYFLDEIQKRYVRMSPPTRDALFRVFRQEDLSPEEVKILEATEFFYSF